MGNYIDQSNIEARFPADSNELTLITTDDADAVAPDPDVITEAITDAEGMIDSYVGKRYVVPLSPVPAIVEKLAVTISLYYLYTSVSNIRHDENIEKNFEKAIEFLKDVSKGNAVLQGATGVEISRSDSLSEGNAFSANDRVFSRTLLEKW